MNDFVYTVDLRNSYRIAYYQQEILQKTTISPIVMTQIGADEKSIYIQPDISGLLSFREFCTTQGFSRELAMNLMVQLLKAAAWCSDHLLDPVCLSVIPGAFYNVADMEMLEIGQIVFVYIPVRDPSTETRSSGLLINMMEQMSGNPVSPFFSEAEMDLLTRIDLYDTENAINAILDFPDTLSESSEHAGNASKGSSSVIHRFRFHPGIRFTLASVLFAQFILLLFTFTVLRNISIFTNPLLPALIVCAVLLLIAASDAILFTHKASPLKQMLSAVKSKPKNEDRDLFSIKDEKTTLLNSDGQNSRIAMICSGIPGTADESSGKKAYVLVDDFLVGRDKTKVDFRIDSLSVGRVHARIIRRHDTFFIEDLDSKNGTFVDKKKLKKNSEYPLPEKCKIRFAGQEFYFVAS
ncbi:MAG: FHA domain-containing protein [Saccharofermentanales bacterium]